MPTEEQDMELIRELRHVSEDLCAAYLVLLPAGHPVRALALAQLGEVLSLYSPFPSTKSAITSHLSDSLLTGREGGTEDPVALLARAVSTLRQAHAELRCAFGIKSGGGREGRRIRERLVRLEKELEVWRDGVRNVRVYG